jgi:serine protease AprX
MPLKIVKILSFCFLTITVESISAQVSPGKYWISFKDKNNSPYSADRPDEFLSEQAIERRTRQHIAFDESDIPVNSVYLDSLKKLGLEIIHTSKWLNGVLVATDNISALKEASDLTFVKDIPLYSAYKDNNPEFISYNKKSELTEMKIDYGLSENQVKMLKGEYLHKNGYQGKNMLIAIIDAGFTNANLISSLQHLWNNNQIFTYRDFVRDSLGIFEANGHGTLVLSIIGGVEQGYIYGTAPEAGYVLIRTENGSSEYIIEEYNWVCGAEFADSIGADVINSSLGYTVFNDVRQNHTYADMDGKTCVSSIGANMASSKGMVVVASAGNEGDGSWFRIGTPADADNILTIGAVDAAEQITDFSSRGPSFDGRVKPDICAQGKGTYVQKSSGDFSAVSGTSVSAPLITGLAACLWQANPVATNFQVMDAIRQSSSRYSNPDEEYGYGIPDFAFADRILKRNLVEVEQPLISFYMYPNPVKDYMNLEIFQNQFTADQNIYISCLDVAGRIVTRQENTLKNESNILHINNIDQLSSGAYTLLIEFSGHIYSLLFVKID